MTNLGHGIEKLPELNDYDVTLERDGRLGLAAFQRKIRHLPAGCDDAEYGWFTLAEAIRDVNPDVPLFF